MSELWPTQKYIDTPAPAGWRKVALRPPKPGEHYIPRIVFAATVPIITAFCNHDEVLWIVEPTWPTPEYINAPAPKGWEKVELRLPRRGEAFLATSVGQPACDDMPPVVVAAVDFDGNVGSALAGVRWILRRTAPPERYELVATGEVRQAEEGEYIKTSDGKLHLWEGRYPSTPCYPIFHLRRVA